jgi:redox-sensitive bicupin YhaK (pirin superfamily)
MEGFQLWVNLPSTHKMTNPRYRGITKKEIPTVNAAPGVTIKIIAGSVRGRIGPVQDLTVPCEYLDITMKPNTTYEQLLSKEFKVFAYIINGEGFFAQQETNPVKPEQVVLFSQGEEIKVTTTDNPLRFLLISGKPLREPVAWLGPIVMNTQQELRTAFNELDKGTFLKTNPDKKPPELHPTYYGP